MRLREGPGLEVLEVDGTGGAGREGAAIVGNGEDSVCNGGARLGNGEDGVGPGDAVTRDCNGRLECGGDFMRQFPSAFGLPLFLFCPSGTDLTWESTSSLPSLKARPTQCLSSFPLNVENNQN